jgi:integrase
LENPTLLLRDSKTGDVLVSELATSFLAAIENQTDYTDLSHFKRVVGFLVDIYGELSVNEFSPKKLKAVRSQMVNVGTLCRRMVNSYTARIIRIFAWGVEEELAKTDVKALREVKNLRKKERGTRDNSPREDVPIDVVERTLPFMSPTIATMVQLQWLTGMRPSEICRMTAGDIDKTRKPGLWHYVPESHKTEEHIGKKAIPLSKDEQELITPYLMGKKPSDAVFSPRTTMQEWKTEWRDNRKTKITPSQAIRNRERAENPTYRVGEFYDSHAYRKAVEYAIIKGNKVLPEGQQIPHWTPYQLRHSAATVIELEHGLDEAQAQLGHTSADMTKRYSKAQLIQREKLALNRRNPFAKKT